MRSGHRSSVDAAVAGEPGVDRGAFHRPIPIARASAFNGSGDGAGGAIVAWRFTRSVFPPAAADLRRARSRTGRQQRVDRDAAKDAHALSAPCSPLTAMAFKLSVRDGSQCKIGCPRFVLWFGHGLGLASGKLAGAPCGFGAVGGNLRRGPARQFGLRGVLA
jgi:hypothetical protein